MRDSGLPFSQQERRLRLGGDPSNPDTLQQTTKTTVRRVRELLAKVGSDNTFMTTVAPRIIQRRSSINPPRSSFHIRLSFIYLPVRRILTPIQNMTSDRRNRSKQERR